MSDLTNFEKYHIDFSFIKNPKIFGSTYLYQVGKLFCDSTTTIDSHTHIDWFELSIVLAGKGDIYTNQKKISVSEGDIVLSFPYDIHKIVSDPNETLKYSFISFRSVDESIKKDFETITQSFYESDKRIFHDQNVVSLTEMLISEISSTEYGQTGIVSDMLHTIAILVIRAFLYKQAKPVPNHITSNEVTCYKVMRYIDSNLFLIENLSDVSAHFNYNYSYLSRTFKHTTRRTLTEYFTNKKLERAKLLIKEGKLSFTEIAGLLRYASLYSFSKSFKFHFGISPSDYKKSHTTSTISS